MSTVPDLKQAQALLEKYNKEDFHRLHARTVSSVMGFFARTYDAQNEQYWRVVGMLHDIDFERYPEEHCVKGEDILRDEGVDESVIRSAMSHGYGLSGTSHAPEHFMEKVLFAADELTGLIWAAALMRPSRSTQDLELKSVKKKYKSKSFAAGCSRDVIEKGAEMLGWDLDRLITETILAMRAYEEESASERSA
ncbi:MAG: hydrolase [Christensenellales bacterium]|jgi:predicted hydrolase (HD superfamily)